MNKDKISFLKHDKEIIVDELLQVIKELEKQDLQIKLLHRQLILNGVMHLLPDVDKQKDLVEEAYLLNLQNLNGREDSEEAFRLGIQTGFDELSEYLTE